MRKFARPVDGALVRVQELDNEFLPEDGELVTVDIYIRRRASSGEIELLDNDPALLSNGADQKAGQDKTPSVSPSAKASQSAKKE